MPDNVATHQRVKCSTPSLMIEEISVMEIEVDPNKAVMIGRIKSVTLTNRKQTGTMLEGLAEEGVITPNRSIITTRSNARTV